MAFPVMMVMEKYVLSGSRIILSYARLPSHKQLYENKLSGKYSFLWMKDMVNKQKFFCLTLKIPGGGGPNGPTFRNIGNGSHMKKNIWYLECM